MNSINETYGDLVLGIAIYGGIFLLLGTILIPDPFKFILGAVLGIVISVLLSIHMIVTIDKALSMEEKRANDYMKSMTLIRSFTMGGVILAALAFSNILNPLAVILGMLCLKFSAYTQPLVSRLLSNRRLKRKVK